MFTSTTKRMLSIAGLCSAVLLVPTAALTQDDRDKDAIEARQGFMEVVVFEAGPLMGMAKGDIPYDAAQATAHAENLDTVLQYDVTRVFVEGTPKPEYEGETRALTAIWDEPEQFAQAFQELRDRVDVVVQEAGKGQPALAAAVTEMGKACGNCHDDYRAEDF